MTQQQNESQSPEVRWALPPFMPKEGLIKQLEFAVLEAQKDLGATEFGIAQRKEFKVQDKPYPAGSAWLEAKLESLRARLAEFETALAWTKLWIAQQCYYEHELDQSRKYLAEATRSIRKHKPLNESLSFYYLMNDYGFHDEFVDLITEREDDFHSLDSDERHNLADCLVRAITQGYRMDALALLRLFPDVELHGEGLCEDPCCWRNVA